MENRSDMLGVSTSDICHHCSEKIYSAITDDEGYRYCCSGCRAVYKILHDNGLDEYYSIRNNSAPFAKRNPLKKLNENYRYLDQEDFLKESSIYENGERRMDFYLEGIHCLACLWLIEKLPDLVNGVTSSKLNMSRSIVSVTIGEEGKFSEATSKLCELGYRPHVIIKDNDADQFRRRENQTDLLRIGIAAACAMNIMIYSVSIYAGAEGFYARWFSWIGLSFSIPVIFYSAIPFYKSAIKSLSQRKINIDLPIAIAIILGFIIGTYNTFTGNPENYFDSITTLVFLILGSRYLLKVSSSRYLDSKSLSHFFSNSSVHRYSRESQQYEDVHERYIEAGDKIKVLGGEIIPADGEVVDGHSLVNTSALTGESIPVHVKKGVKVFSGTINLDSDFIMSVSHVREKTRIGKILKKIENGWSGVASITRFSDKIAQYFVGVVLTLAIASFLYFTLTLTLEQAISRSLALVIITCPCAIGLAIPLAFTRSLASLRSMGIIIKNEESIERAAGCKNIFLDKTGTLTYGSPRVVSWQNVDSCNVDTFSLVYILEKFSSHPVAVALKDYIEENAQIHEYDVQNVREIFGVGVSGDYRGSHYEIVDSGEENTNKKIALLENGIVLAEILLRDTIRDDAEPIVKKLIKNGYNIEILSGDNESIVKQTGQKLEILPEKLHADLKPEDKNKIIEESENAIMIGDGANDALALSRASVGVAVSGSVDVSLRAADVYITRPGVRPIYELAIVSRETMKVVYRNFSFSLVYNVSGALLALNGMISPLWAAVLMPLSSLTVIFSSLYGTGKMKQIFKGGKV